MDMDMDMDMDMVRPANLECRYRNLMARTAIERKGR